MEKIKYVVKLSCGPTTNGVECDCVFIRVAHGEDELMVVVNEGYYVLDIVAERPALKTGSMSAKAFLNNTYGRYADTDSLRQGGDFDVCRVERDGAVVAVYCDRLEFDQALLLASMLNEHDSFENFSVVRHS